MNVKKYYKVKYKEDGKDRSYSEGLETIKDVHDYVKFLNNRNISNLKVVEIVEVENDVNINF